MHLVKTLSLPFLPRLQCLPKAPIKPPVSTASSNGGGDTFQRSTPALRSGGRLVLNLSDKHFNQLLLDQVAQTKLRANLKKGREQHRQNLASFFEKCLKDFTDPEKRIEKILNTLKRKYAGKPHELLMELGATLSETHGFLTGIEKVDASFVFSFLPEWESFQKELLRQFRRNQRIHHQDEAIEAIADMRDKQHQFLPIANSMESQLEALATVELSYMNRYGHVPHPDDVLITAVTYDSLKRTISLDIHLVSQLRTLPPSLFYTTKQEEVVFNSDIPSHLQNPEVSSQGVKVQEVLDQLLLSVLDPFLRRGEVIITPSTSIGYRELPPKAFATAFQRDW
jgi:hypothetical protein